MNWNNRSFRIGFCCAFGLFCLAIAFLVVDALRDQSQTPLTTFSSRETSVTGPPKPPDLDYTSQFQNSSSEMSDLGALVRVLSAFERTMALDRLVDDAKEVRLRDLFKQAGAVQPRHLRDEFQVGIIRRFAMLDPSQALSLIDENGEDGQGSLISAIFEEWSAADTVQAIEHLGNLEDTLQRYALQGLLQSGVELPEGVRSALGRDSDIQQFSLDQRAAAILATSLDNPASEWHSLLADFGSDLESFSQIQRDAVVHVALEWLAQDRIAAMPTLMESFLLRNDKVWLTEGILQGLVATDRDSLRSFAAEMERTHQWVLLRAIENWAATDGENALDAARMDGQRRLGQSRENAANGDQLMGLESSAFLNRSVAENSRTTATVEPANGSVGHGQVHAGIGCRRC